MVLGHPKVIQRKGENVWVTYIKNRVFRKNNSINIVMTGETGSGKSWAMLGLAQSIDPNFSIDNVYFKLSEFVKDITENKFKKGSIVIFDEAGVDLNSANWQSMLNKSMNIIMQTIRHRNLIIILNVPQFSFISKGVRKLLSAHWESHGYDKNNYSIIKPMVMQYNDELDKIYKKRLVVQSSPNSAFCSFIKIKKASDELLKAYEIIKTEYTSNLYSQLYQELKSYESLSEEKMKKRSNKNLTDIQEDTLRLMKEGKLLPDIAKEQCKSEGAVYKVFTALRNKEFLKISTVKDTKKNDKGVFISKVSGYNIEDTRDED